MGASIRRNIHHLLRVQVAGAAGEIAGGVGEDGGDGVAAVDQGGAEDGEGGMAIMSRATGLPRLLVPLATNCTLPLGVARLGALASAAKAKVTLLVGGTVHLSEATPTVALAGVTVNWPLGEAEAVIGLLTACSGPR